MKLKMLQVQLLILPLVQTCDDPHDYLGQKSSLPHLDAAGQGARTIVLFVKQVFLSMRDLLA